MNSRELNNLHVKKANKAIQRILDKNKIVTKENE